MYRNFVEVKASRIAPVKRILMESAMDCELQQSVNDLPADWRNLSIPQIRSQDGKTVSMKLSELASPTFETITGLTCNVKEQKEDSNHNRPLSTYIDLKDEMFDKFVQLFEKKQVWQKEDLLKHPLMRMYSHDSIIYLLHNAMDTGLQLKDMNGRIGHMESKGNLYNFAIGKYDTMQDKYLPKEHGRQVRLDDETVVEEIVESNIPNIDEKIETYKWIPGLKERFSREILEWFIVDHVLTKKEKISHMLNLDWNNPPIYAKPLKISEGPIYVLGSSELYDSTKNKFTPIGEQLDAYNEWVSELKQKFINYKTQYFGTMKGNALLFNLQESGTELKRADRSKNISGRTCTTYTEQILNLFSEFLEGKPFPNSVTNKKSRCDYIALLIREAIIKEKEDIVWWTPEEWSILNEDSNRKELVAKLKTI
jgi:hypothetical protein